MNAVLEGDTAVGHTDIQGNPVVGTIVALDDKVIVQYKKACKSGSIVTFPSHPHAIINGSPANYRSHSIAVVNQNKMNTIAKSGDVVLVADEAGGNALLVGTGVKLQQ